MTLPSIMLKPGREKPLLNRHPWVFSGAIAKAPQVAPGSLIDIRDHRGRFLARGYYNEHSQIRARVLTFDENEGIDLNFWKKRLAQASARRSSILEAQQNGATNAVRMVMSEADLLPGLIIDRYDRFLVLQVLTAGINRHLDTIVEALTTLQPWDGIFERSDDHVRELEGLKNNNRLLHGREPEAGEVVIQENGLTFAIDFKQGHKTGYYLDQRRNRLAIRSLAKGRHVLDCFSYTGGFTLNACAGGAASVLSVDASGSALARLKHNISLNQFDHQTQLDQREGNAFEILRQLSSEKPNFDLIILDPPKFAAHGSQVEKAARGYKDLNLQAFKMLRPGGILATFSCSGHISADLFQKIIFGAAVDAGVEAQIIDWFYQGEDHPVLLSFPESLYLKGLVCQVVSKGV